MITERTTLKSWWRETDARRALVHAAATCGIHSTWSSPEVYRLLGGPEQLVIESAQIVYYYDREGWPERFVQLTRDVMKMETLLANFPDRLAGLMHSWFVALLWLEREGHL